VENLGEDSSELSELHSEGHFGSCEKCKKLFSCSNNLSGHATVSSRKTTSHCEMCVTSFTHKRSAMRWFRGRELPFSCNVCNKTFSSPSKLEIHIRVHSGERPFSCEVYKKTFNQRSNLKGISEYTLETIFLRRM
jgi:KRAB domain-containing zinc finger protein